MRHYATVHGGSENVLPASAGDLLKKQASNNLRLLRIEAGYDYVGFDIAGRLIDYAPDLDIAAVRRQLDWPGDVLARTRLLVSPDVVPDLAVEVGFDLLLAVHSGKNYAWRGGGKNSAGLVTIDPKHRAPKVSAILLDVFQDIMVANSPSITSVIDKFKAAGGTMAGFYAMKAEFAAHAAEQGPRPLFEIYEPQQYASFSALAREDFHPSMTDRELRRFADYWTDFLLNRLSQHFLTAEEAAEVVREEKFRTSRAERVEGRGQKSKSRSQREYLAERDLIAILRDRQVVDRAGSYVLCIVNRPSGPGLDDMAPLFDWARPGRIRRMKLCSERQYEKMKNFVRRGWVTPIRLFLQEPPTRVRS